MWNQSMIAHFEAAGRNTCAESMVRRARLSGSSLFHLGRAMRPQQWAKNSLVLVPLIAAPGVDLELAARAVLAFAAFCLCASGAYLMNDALDVDADRLHPTKRRRPFASGALPVAWGLPAAAFATILGVAIATRLPASFAAALVMYVAAAGVYSTWLKRHSVVDVGALACLYTLRLVAGGLAVGMPVSGWLAASSLCLFLSLACGKRHAELARLAASRGNRSAGRGYAIGDRTWLRWLGMSSGYLAGLTLAICVIQGALSDWPWGQQLFWMVAPLYFFWITRFWLKTSDGAPLEDPLAFVLRDPFSVALGGGVVLWLQVGASL
jgi:4-hydroxybenzoate polyprenyltransferase